MSDNKLTLDLLPEFFFGAEGEDDAAGTQGSESNDVDDSTDEGVEDTADDDEDDDNEHDDADDPKVQGLKAALKAERLKAKREERRANTLAKKVKAKDLAEMGELDAAKTQLTESQDKISKLASGLLRRDLDAAIRKAAAKANFVDPEDAVALVNRSSLTYTQDEDDPSDIEIDTKTIIAEVKRIAQGKPHFIKGQGAADDDEDPSGSKFGRKGKKKSTEEELKEKYPALR